MIITLWKGDNMSKAKSGDTVRIHYTGTLDDGTEFDSSRDREPLEFSVGGGQVIQGFDSAVEGMEEGEKKSVSLEPGDAYGEHQDELVQKVERSNLPPDLEYKEGMVLQATQPNGMPLVLHVVEVNDDAVTLDANHPLAGKKLNFDLELVEIK